MSEKELEQGGIVDWQYWNQVTMSVRQTCIATNLSRSTVQKLAFSGELPSFTVGTRRLFPVAGVLAWMRSKTPSLPHKTDDVDMKYINSLLADIDHVKNKERRPLR